MNTSVKPPVWFWVVSVIALLWNLLGVMNYLNLAFNQVALMEAMDQAQREVFEGIPAWATAAFAIAVFSGNLGIHRSFSTKKMGTSAFYRLLGSRCDTICTLAIYFQCRGSVWAVYLWHANSGRTYRHLLDFLC